MKSEEHRPRLQDSLLTRRELLSRLGMGFGALSLSALLAEQGLLGSGGAAAGTPLAAKRPHFPAKATRVVHVFAQGAPSQVDTWDPKPALARHDGKELPGLGGVAMASPFQFHKRGRAGIEVSEVFPRLGDLVDELAIIRSMHTDVPAHDLATVMMNTGSLRLLKPSLGSWVLYGLGSENENMPGYVSLRPNALPPGGAQNWQSAFLPGVFQAMSLNTRLPGVEELIGNIRNPYITLAEQRRQLDLVHRLNELHSQKLPGEEQLEARLQAFEMAFRMQAEATDAFDLAKEPPSVRERYGNSNQGKQLLITRRLLERGVRFVQVWAGGWDHHNDLEERLREQAQEIDQPLAAFLTDLKERGLLESTLVVWGGEFGRKPVKDRNGNDNPGRDHNNRGFSLWLAGGGVRKGTIYGATDEIGAQAVQDPVHIHDLHATILALLGLDHERLTYRYNGRDFRLTDVYGQVVRGILA